MKRSNLLLSFLAMFFGLSLVFSSQFVFGQDSKNEKKVKVKIVQNINGETKTIEKNFSISDDEELQNLLKEYDLNIDRNDLLKDQQVEINIRKSTGSANDEEVVVNIDKDQDLVSQKAFLGVITDDVTDEAIGENSAGSGVVIAKVLPESAAEKAGLKEGDLITKINETEITDGKQLRETVHSLEPGDEVTIHYQRDGNKFSAIAKLEEKAMPDFPMFLDKDFDWQGQLPPAMRFNDNGNLKDKPFLGVFPGELSDNTVMEAGVVIGEVVEKSTAQELGLKKGDVIVQINDKPVKNFDELRETIGNIKVGDELKVEWKRGGQIMSASAPLKSRAENDSMCFKWNSGKMPPECGRWMHGFDQPWGDNQQVTKEDLSRQIERLENEIQDLKEKLNGLNSTGAERVEETKMTITIEDVSKNNLEAENLMFSPNPNNGKFALSFELPGKGKTTVKIFDVSNKEIFSESLGKFSGRYDKQIDISENPKGIYFLQITQDNKALNKKIAIQ